VHFQSAFGVVVDDGHYECEVWSARGERVGLLGTTTNSRDATRGPRG
jgi:hypothetical protein